MKGKEIFLVAAENGALPRGKVGGVGDVIRDLPIALADLEWQPTVLTPAYGMFDKLPGAKESNFINVAFGGAIHSVSVFTVPGLEKRVRHIAFEHGTFSPQGPAKIYCDDGADRPFATDATKFAFFCAVVASYINELNEPPDVVHLHDWHCALYLALRAFDPRYRNLQNIRTVYTIHNLAMQGIRPLTGDSSSLQSWFPNLDYDEKMLSDPHYSDCVNPMATAIRLADKLNTVSPTYAQEILRESEPKRGFIGSEGLETALRQATTRCGLIGILNGCAYTIRDYRRPNWRHLLAAIDTELQQWTSKESSTKWIHDLARTRISEFPDQRPSAVITSIGRLTAQKIDLFLTTDQEKTTAIETILGQLGTTGVFIMLGSGDATLQRRIAEIALENKRFLFLCGYSESFSDMLYDAGDLFLMPSSFEPCGISQMLAMRAGQPCVVHSIGGLKDTIHNELDGFSFDGNNPATQAGNFVKTVQSACQLKAIDPDRWQGICDRAAAARFTWRSAAKQYIEKIYE